MTRALVEELVRSGFLFVLSVVLVLGFYFHASFYSVGFGPLVVLGSVVTFLLLTSVRVLVSGSLPTARPVGSLSFTKEQMNPALLRPVVSVILPLGDDVVLGGEVVRAVDETDREFARLRAVDGRRKLLADLTDEEARTAGLGSAEEVREKARREWHLGPDDPIALLAFERTGTGR